MYVIYSASESGYWSNELGWVEDRSQSTVFTLDERLCLNLPISTNNDSRWLKV